MKKLLVILILGFLSLSFNWDNYVFFRLNGDRLTFKEMLSEHDKTVLFLWASKCWACRRELERSDDCESGKHEIQFHYINLGESKATVEKFAKNPKLKQCVKDNIVLDKEAALVYKYDVMFIPTFLFFKDSTLLKKTNYISEGLLNEIYNDE